MNFTRDPIIETVITARDGCRLSLRSTSAPDLEEFLVDAVEVVTFGHAYFYRSNEKPRPFLLPISDYEVLEVKEARMVLKNAQPDRTIKIGGGRDAPLRSQARVEEDDEPAERPERSPERNSDRNPERSQERSSDRNNKGRGNNNRRNRREQRAPEPLSPPPMEASDAEAPMAEEVIAPVLTKLLPPPTTLIRDTLPKLKPLEEEEEEETQDE